MSDFMPNIIGLLESQVKKLTGGESTSISVEKAGELLNSIFYTLGIASNSDALVGDELSKRDLENLLSSGQYILNEKRKSVYVEWKLMYTDSPGIPNVYFKDTLCELGKFFHQYDTYFYADMIPCSITYPLLCNVSESLKGISFIERYIHNLQIENDFLNCFDINILIALYRTVFSDYEELLFNLSDQVLTNAIGLSLIGGDVKKLSIREDERERISSVLREKSTGEVEYCIRNATRSACKDLGIRDIKAKEYLENAAAKTVPHILEALKAGDISFVFMSF